MTIERSDVAEAAFRDPIRHSNFGAGSAVASRLLNTEPAELGSLNNTELPDSSASAARPVMVALFFPAAECRQNNGPANSVRRWYLASFSDP
jgi:hypothetical protein